MTDDLKEEFALGMRFFTTKAVPRMQSVIVRDPEAIAKLEAAADRVFNRDTAIGWSGEHTHTRPTAGRERRYMNGHFWTHVDQGGQYRYFGEDLTMNPESRKEARG